MLTSRNSMTCVFSTLTPLIFSGIFYASNGKYPVAYIDALFNSVSAMTMCGLATVNLSELTAWQQVLLFIQMCIGNPVRSLTSGVTFLILAQGHRVVGDGLHQEVIIYSVRVSDVHSLFYRHYFAKTFDHIIGVEAGRLAAIKVEQQLAAASVGNSVGNKGGWPRRIFRRKTGLSTVQEDSTNGDARTIPKDSAKRLRPDMIRRMDGRPKLVNPSGRITESGAVSMNHSSLESLKSLNLQAEEQEQEPSPHQLVFADGKTQTPEQLELENNVKIKNLHVETINVGPTALKRNTS